MAIVVHMPEPILRSHESLREEGVVFVVGPDVGNAPGIPAYIHRLLQPRHVQSGGDIGECGLQVGVGDATGHNPSRANSC
jgi:hypothetical protein